LPGSDGPVKTYEDAVAVAETIGYPVILKAAAGGGGRGMRICTDETMLQGAFDTARSEAERAFGSADVYVEKYLERPRHIEIQVFGDSSGRIVSLGERECTIQRRHQKLIEESPSPAISQELRHQMGDAAIRLCLIVKGKDREETLARGRRALDLFIIEGVKTTIPLHRAILDDPGFIRGDFSTKFLDDFEW